MYNCDTMVVKCYLDDKFIGEVEPYNSLLIISNNEKTHKFRKNDIAFKLLAFGDESLNDKNIIAKGFCDNYEKLSDEKLNQPPYTLCLHEHLQTWTFNCYLDNKNHGWGRLYDSDVIKIESGDNLLFFHNCIKFRLTDGMCFYHDNCINDAIIMSGTCMPMIIKKHIHCVPEIFQKMRLVILNEPFILVGEEFYHHESLFTKKEAMEINSIENWPLNLRTSITLKCANCDKTIKTYFSVE